MLLVEQYGTAFHDLSEGFGLFIVFALQEIPYLALLISLNQVDGFLDLLYGSNNGFWDLNGQMLDSIAESIAAKFDFTVEQAGS